MVNGVDTQKSCEIAERAEQMRALFSRAIGNGNAIDFGKK